MTDSWTVKVCDLGTARFCSLALGPVADASLARTAALDDLTRGVGTLLWSAPEVRSGFEMC